MGMSDSPKFSGPYGVYPPMSTITNSSTAQYFLFLFSYCPFAIPILQCFIHFRSLSFPFCFPTSISHLLCPSICSASNMERWGGIQQHGQQSSKQCSKPANGTSQIVATQRGAAIIFQLCSQDHDGHGKVEKKLFFFHTDRSVCEKS